MFDGKEMLDRFNVEIKFNKTRFQASSDVFPSCIGYGKTQEEALDELGSSIGNLLGRISKKTLRQMFKQDSYTEILLDGAPTNGMQKRTYSFGKSPINRKFLGIKPVSTQKLGDVHHKKSMTLPDMEDISSFSQRSFSEADTITIQDMMSDEIIQNHQSDGMAFGFHISMN